jgi:hypothetical protein
MRWAMRETRSRKWTNGSLKRSRSTDETCARMTDPGSEQGLSSGNGLEQKARRACHLRPPANGSAGTEHIGPGEIARELTAARDVRHSKRSAGLTCRRISRCRLSRCALRNQYYRAAFFTSSGSLGKSPEAIAPRRFSGAPSAAPPRSWAQLESATFEFGATYGPSPGAFVFCGLCGLSGLRSRLPTPMSGGTGDM